MNELIARPIIKNKYWIVESDGNKVGTIQAVEKGGFVYVHEQSRVQYASIKLLSKAHNVVFDSSTNKKEKVTSESHEVYGYPVSNKPWNSLWDVKHQFPIYTKTNKSKSYYCAGYYIIKFNNGWVKSYCPKFITLNRYDFQGPFKDKTEMQNALKAAK